MFSKVVDKAQKLYNNEIHYHFQEKFKLLKPLIESPTKKDSITICMGPGCKAWDSEVLLMKLKGEKFCIQKKISLIEKECLNNCGGGITIKLPVSDTLIKIRNPDNFDKIVKILSGEDEEVKG